jgi:serine/threonine protein kinase
MAASLVADACKALEYAHTLKGDSGKPLNLVHRDISPDNLMVDRKGHVRLLDFGIARSEETETTTLTGLRKGKLRYMAPEYVLDHAVNAQIDVYAMGATLFELVTGMKPFGDKGTAELYDSLAKAELPPADMVRPSLPPPLVGLIRAATRRKPEQRTRTARELEAGLREFLKAWPPPEPEEIGLEVAIWRQKHAAGLAGKRSAGSFGQLESTEMIEAPRELDAPAADLDVTPVRSPVVKQRDVSELNVVLAPDLAAVAQRSRGPRKKKVLKKK